MLSTGAFNALLKTLEEPPEHVKFILATTEPQKLLATILSRCQRFDFKKISNEDIIKRLKIVCKESDIKITETALNLIATLSEGAARDALSILERCVQEGSSDIDENKVKDLVGIPKFQYVHTIIKGIIEKDIEKSLKSLQDILDEGKDLENFLWEMIKYVKDILMYKVSKKADIYSEEETKQIKEIANQASKEELINIIYKLSELENKMRISSQKTILFEIEIIKLCTKIDTLAIEERLTKLEEKIESGNCIPKTQPKEEQEKINEYQIPKINMKSSEQERKQELSKQEEKKTNEKANIATSITQGDKITAWQEVINNLKKQGKVMLYANLINTEAVEVNDMTVAIRFNNGLNDFRRDLLQKPENMNALVKEVSIICGKPMQIKLEDVSTQNVKINPVKKEIKQEPKIEKNEEDILDGLDIPINIIEE